VLQAWRSVGLAIRWSPRKTLRTEFHRDTSRLVQTRTHVKPPCRTAHKAEHGQRPGRARPSGLGWQPGLLARLPGGPGDLHPSTPPTRGGVRRRCRLNAQGPGCTANCTSICRTEQTAASSLPLHTSASAQYQAKRSCPNKTFGSLTDRVPIARSEGRHAPRGEAYTLATIKISHGLKMREGGEAGAEMARNSGSQLLLSSSHQVAVVHWRF
jgi:hypothetical protein